MINIYKCLLLDTWELIEKVDWMRQFDRKVWKSTLKNGGARKVVLKILGGWKDYLILFCWVRFEYKVCLKCRSWAVQFQEGKCSKIWEHGYFGYFGSMVVTRARGLNKVSKLWHSEAKRKMWKLLAEKKVPLKWGGSLLEETIKIHSSVETSSDGMVFYCIGKEDSKNTT